MADVRLPDGRIIRNVPEGITQDELMRRIELADRQSRRVDLTESNRAEFDPSSAEFQERFGAVSASDAFDNFTAGIGKAIVDTGRGLKQLGLQGLDFVDPFDSETLDSAVASSQQDIDLARQRDEALLNTGSGLAGNITGNVGVALAPGAVLGRTSAIARGLTNPQTLRTAAGSGAAFGATQPVATGESRAFNVGAGAVGGGIGKVIAQPVANSLSRGAEEAVDLLRRSGVPLDAAQRTGSRAFQTVRSMLGDSVLTGGIQGDFVERQARGFTRAALRTIGSEADEATPQVMAEARRRIGKVFDTTARRTPPRFDDALESEIVDILDRAPANLVDADVKVLARNVDDILNAVDSNNVFNGNKFNRIRSNLGRLSRRPDVGGFARDLDQALLNSLERASPTQAAALRKASQQWRNLRLIQGSIEKGGDRFISPLRLSNTIGSKANQNLSVFDLGGELNVELANLARAGREVLPEILGNSGTAARQQQATLGVLEAGAAATGAPFAAQSLLNAQNPIVSNLIDRGFPGVTGDILRQAPSAGGRTLQSQIFESELP